MKFSYITFIFFLFFSTNVLATSYLTQNEIADIVSFLPLPPKENSHEFTNDKLQYEWGKTIRNSTRGKQAIEDANKTPSYIAKIFSQVSKTNISPKTTPITYNLIQNISDTTRIASIKAKSHFYRQRPFVFFKEKTPLPQFEKKYIKNSSYPSGHTLIGWINAIILAELLPASQKAILHRGYEYGQSRVIVGYHYQTDVDTSRIIAGSLVASLFQNPQFQQDFNSAKQELQNLTTPSQKP